MNRDLHCLEQNLRLAMRFFGTATGTGEIHVLDSAEAVYSGLDYGVFNMAFLTGGVDSARQLAGILADCGRYYAERPVFGSSKFPVKRVRWSFWLCEDFLDVSVRRRRADVFAEAGLRPISQAPGMLAPALPPPSRPLPEIECREVEGAALRSAFTAITSVCFDIPMDVARSVYEPEQAWKGEYRGYVGFVQGKPVSIVALVRAAGCTGIYSLGTLPEFRRHGYGEALLRAALAHPPAGAAPNPGGGSEFLVLESTEAGYPLYRHLGFRDIARFTVYLTK